VTVPARPAASLVVIDERPDLHVLLGRRRPGAFVGDMIVYPGGAVDDDDWRLGPTLVPGATAPGLSAADAAAAPGLLGEKRARESEYGRQKHAHMYT